MRLSRLCSLTLLLLMLASAAPLAAGDYTGVARFSADDLITARSAGFDTVMLGDADILFAVGSPALPCTMVNVALPGGATVTGVKSLGAEFVELDGTFDIMPCARPRRIGNEPQGNPFIKDTSVYGADARYPAETVEFVHTWDLAGQQFATLRVAPVQYNPVTGKLYLAKSVSYEVAYTVDPGFARQTYNFSERTRERTLENLQRMAANPGAVSIPAWNGAGSRALDPGNWEYVVVTTTSWENEFDTLLDHYTLTGLPATVVTTDYIYANYSGGSDAEKIRNFIIDAQAAWGTIYVLIGGDTDVVPYHKDEVGGDSIPNDTYYADYDYDWKCEVYVGRACVNSVSEIGNFISKTMDYMTDPPAGFGDEALMMGFDLDSATPSELLMEYILDHWKPSWLELYKEYDSETGDHEDDVKAYINAGKNLVDHSDHCNYSVLGVGSYRHGDHIYNSECQAFYNDGKWGLFNSLGCYTGAYDYSDCWGEVWCNDTDGGGIIFVGNTRYGWYMPGGGGLSFSGLYNRKYFKAIWLEDWNFYHSGEAHCESKNLTFPDNGTERYIFTELNLYGDPAVPLWTKVPGTMTCTYGTTIDPGLQSFDIVVDAGGTPVADALVCLWKGDQVYERGVTDAAGCATLIISPQDAGNMKVTVTAQNQLPWMGDCTVTSSALPDLAVALALNGTTFAFLDYLTYDIEVANSSGSSKDTWLWTNITMPDLSTFPGSGYLNGPMKLTIVAYDSVSGSLSKLIPPLAPTGTYMFNAFIGQHPSIDDDEHKVFSVY